MASNYRRGYNFEYKVKKMLENAGLLVTRAPASKSPADIYVLGNQNYLIQCKTTSKDKLYLYGLDKLRKLCEKHGAKPLLAYSFRYTKPYIKEIDSDKVKMRRDEEHQSLEEWLKGLCTTT